MVARGREERSRSRLGFATDWRMHPRLRYDAHQPEPVRLKGVHGRNVFSGRKLAAYNVSLVEE